MPTDTPPCPAPCPTWCTRPTDHGTYSRASRTWRRIHLGDQFDSPAGEACWEQTDVVTRNAVTPGPLVLATAVAEVVVAPAVVAA